ncbi:MAG: MBL fold metallo-hydrolase [Candidatus Bathyarchaeota archaeon]|nr:MBL fold metallo-hydrolase [Candidatus Bathyarchaeota archaeon]
MVSLTFYGGVNEIGGNKVLVEDRGTRVFFDFGQSFTFGADYFLGWLGPRSVNGLGDYFEFNLLPRLEGLYAEDLLAFTDLPYAEPMVDAVFLSHAHFDHVNHIQFLDPKIPLYLGEGTKLFLEGAEETSGSCNYGDHRYETFRTGDKIALDGLVVEPVHVDHSIPAAYGFLIHTSEGTIVYTGDLRAHGPRSDMTGDFVDKACQSEPVAMICEGTRMVEVERRKNHSEQEVQDLATKITSSTDKMVFVARYSRDMDRFRSFYNLAKMCDRRIVISPKAAYLLDKLVEDKRLDLPDPSEDEDILVYYKRKRSGQFDESDYYCWERQFMDKMVTYDLVHENQDRLVMDLDFYQFGELIDVRPDSGSHFIHSMSEPYSEEDIENQVMCNWLDHFEMEFRQLHASGHLNRDQLIGMVERIEPRRVFPIHTENQLLFGRNCRNVEVIEYGKEYIVS